ncbi:DUF302 domain-containing protein [Halomonas sp. SpR1]|uniref:DUF302 domain-containing protein n=1 Tax=Halomonas sp. SpR1 TaxID=3050462 RepID=UPI0027E5895A|nr:DUF302 domain-containing protein [Halomonas sp. SpR1]MDQ7732184.1 DUF302 domain-containing protein [Halomonas sp. SpR1]
MAMLLSFSLTSKADQPINWPQQGWNVMVTEKPYADLVDDLRSAVSEADMIVVTEASPTHAAAQRGEIIPGNRVIGVFRNDFAVTIIRESVPAMIEAPLRFYVTEDDAESATLSWKNPRDVFAPYITEHTPDLANAAQELDVIFQQIGDNAVAP